MKYFVNFKDNKVQCSWEREHASDHPTYLTGKFYEVSKEQYDGRRFLILENDEVKWQQPKYNNYLAKQSNKSKKGRVRSKIKSLSNVEIANLTQAQKNKLLIFLVDAVFDRDEISLDEDLN